MTASGTTVEIDNTKITNAQRVANVAEGNELILNNAYIDSSNTNGITNAGTLTLKGTNTINEGVTGTGTANVETGTTTLGADVTQGTISIATGSIQN